MRIVPAALPRRLHTDEAGGMTAPTFDLGTLHGGLRLPILKDESTAQVIQHVPVPAQLVLPWHNTPANRLTRLSASARES